MGDAKVGRAALLRMEAEVVEFEEAFDALKQKRRACSECGRPIRERNQTKNDKALEAQIRKAAHELRAKRQAFRKAQGR
jgi:transcription initiation factor IIE alpha subunit